MIRVYMMPRPSDAVADNSNAINQIVLRLQKHLPAYGVELVEDKSSADLVVAHAGQSDGLTVPDVAHVHGLYPTAHSYAEETPNWHWAANKHVIENVRLSKAVTVPSQWVADLFRRDMHLNPSVIGWAIEPDEWEPGINQNYILWNKTRPDSVCNPQPLIDLAIQAPHQRFLTTFGNGTPNVKTIGRQPFEKMKPIIQNAGVYLATTKETFGIGTLEAMACGVPILGFNWGGTADLVEHGKTGYLVEPGDQEGLLTGLEYCLKNRDILGLNAREVAITYSWGRVAEQFANLYKAVLEPRVGPKVTVVIPCHNYAHYIKQAIDSVKAQKTSFEVELIVVLDRCTDNSDSVVLEALCELKNVDIISTDFGNPADARNRGIELAQGEYITCLDADDALGDPQFLQTLADELDRDRSLGIVYTGLQIMNGEGALGHQPNWPPVYDFDAQCDRKNCVPTCNMFRREAWERAGGYRRKYFVAEDAELWLRMGTVGYRGKLVTTEPWFHYRMHGDSLSAAVRTGDRPEPDWTLDKPWLLNGQRPFAADGVAPKWSWPVRNYDKPRISFIVPCAPHHRDLLPEALDSIEGQTVRDWECIVVNDSDQPLVLPGYPWIRIVNTDKRGAGHARNMGIQAATAPLIAFLDADDTLSPRYLELTLRAHARTGRYVYTDWISLNKEGQKEAHETPDFEIGAVFRQTSIHSINVLIPRDAVIQVGGFDEQMVSWEDVDFFMKLAVAGVCGIRVAERLVMYRYQTGALREHGETIKDKLRALLRERYKDYIEGGKMCGCTEPPKKKIAMNANASANGHDDMVRVEYKGAPGQHSVIGLVTKQNYGRRAGGDTFYVFNADQREQPQRFLPITEVVREIIPTPVPPEPEPIRVTA